MSDQHSKHDLESKKRIREDIKKHGFHLGQVEADNYLPRFAYTIGLYETYKHPEIICFGLSDEVMSYIFNELIDRIREGEVFKPYTDYHQFLKNHPIQLIPVEKDFYSYYVGYAGWYYDSFDFPLLQFVWTDREGRFPWKDDFSEDLKFLQPILDRDVDFKFYEERNLGVYTTQQVLEGEPILFVYHNENGDWEFYSSTEPTMENAKIVALEQMTKLDPTLNDIHYLPYGHWAWRDTVEDNWEYDEMTDDE